MRKLKTTSSFRTDLKKLNSAEEKEAKDVITKLMNDESLDIKYRDHELHGNYKEAGIVPQKKVYGYEQIVM